MMICRSKLKIFKKGEKKDFECELLVLNNLKDEENQVIIIAKNNQRTFKNYKLEDFSNTCFYDFLSELFQQHKEYKLSDDMNYLVSIFNDNLALNYININNHSESIIMEKVVDSENDIYAKIVTYELSIRLILKDILDMDCVTDLYNESFKTQLNKYIEKQMLKKISFLNSIKVNRIIYKNTDSVAIKIEKINSYKTFDIILESLFLTKLQVDRIDDIEFAFTRGIYINSRKNKKCTFIEENQGDVMLVIANKGKYTADEIRRKFYLKNSKCYGKVVIGVTYCSNINYV